MDIQIIIPSIEDVLKKGMPLKVAAENESWYQNGLGDYAKKSGVYIHHANGNILYVGQTSKNGKWGKFHVRLRRECQPKAASNNELYQLLFRHAKYARTTMYHFEEIKAMFLGSIKDYLTPEKMTLILEQVMIAMYHPTYNKK